MIGALQQLDGTEADINAALNKLYSFSGLSQENVATKDRLFKIINTPSNPIAALFKAPPATGEAAETLEAKSKRITENTALFKKLKRIDELDQNLPTDKGFRINQKPGLADKLPTVTAEKVNQRLKRLKIMADFEEHVIQAIDQNNNVNQSLIPEVKKLDAFFNILKKNEEKKPEGTGNPTRYDKLLQKKYFYDYFIIKDKNGNVIFNAGFFNGAAVLAEIENPNSNFNQANGVKDVFLSALRSYIAKITGLDISNPASVESQLITEMIQDVAPNDDVNQFFNPDTFNQIIAHVYNANEPQLPFISGGDGIKNDGILGRVTAEINRIIPDNGTVPRAQQAAFEKLKKDYNAEWTAISSTNTTLADEEKKIQELRKAIIVKRTTEIAAGIKKLKTINLTNPEKSTSNISVEGFINYVNSPEFKLFSDALPIRETNNIFKNSAVLTLEEKVPGSYEFLHEIDLHYNDLKELIDLVKERLKEGYTWPMKSLPNSIWKKYYENGEKFDNLEKDFQEAKFESKFAVDFRNLVATLSEIEATPNDQLQDRFGIYGHLNNNDNIGVGILVYIDNKIQTKNNAIKRFFKEYIENVELLRPSLKPGYRDTKFGKEILGMFKEMTFGNINTFQLKTNIEKLNRFFNKIAENHEIDFKHNAGSIGLDEVVTKELAKKDFQRLDAIKFIDGLASNLANNAENVFLNEIKELSWKQVAALENDSNLNYTHRDDKNLKLDFQISKIKMALENGQNVNGLIHEFKSSVCKLTNLFPYILEPIPNKKGGMTYNFKKLDKIEELKNRLTKLEDQEIQKQLEGRLTALEEKEGGVGGNYDSAELNKELEQLRNKLKELEEKEGGVGGNDNSAELEELQQQINAIAKKVGDNVQTGNQNNGTGFLNHQPIQYPFYTPAAAEGDNKNAPLIIRRKSEEPDNAAYITIIAAIILIALVGLFIHQQIPTAAASTSVDHSPLVQTPVTTPPLNLNNTVPNISVN